MTINKWQMLRGRSRRNVRKSVQKAIWMAVPANRTWPGRKILPDGRSKFFSESHLGGRSKVPSGKPFGRPFREAHPTHPIHLGIWPPDLAAAGFGEAQRVHHNAKRSKTFDISVKCASPAVYEESAGSLFFIILSFICFYFFVRFISTSGKTSKKCFNTRSCILQPSTLNCGEATLQGPMLIRWSVCWSMKTEQFTFRHIRTGETTPSIHCIVHTVLFLHCDEVSNHRWHPFPSHPEMKRGTILFRCVLASL